ncbi:glycoside hydrolase [Halobacillus halophilus]|uniref:Group 1 glycosyltransferase n=1 Tax=Halobacillus halophilus (strain ATCC 35676 / DSM 2266 / JCM 20832 / KCTC 3685 / LMG 17431 / NBRC 102448 / NCIMB 2269) TaxID=866895 RepID=I0JQN0_HALH3|nr:GT4 family glycosyltransferase PelF [Halobacillus halophilus]ASF40461.1 glycoside hydrolase [Halobacillus halophilus]CCG46450.1 group 1 glycosyltransferase [Halobacillus halophilus DSM 2266]
MRIGMVVEGSYPYVSGGVASWVQMIITQMPKHEFVIIAITPKEMSVEDYRYDLPSNVVQVENLPLNFKQKTKKRRIPLTESDQVNLTEWMMFSKVESQALDVFSQKLGTREAFFSSELFWRLVQGSYQKENQSGSFIDYFWMWRGMFTPIIELLQFPFPEVDLIHSASTGYAGLVAASIKRQQNVPFLLTEHGIYSREREEEILQAGWIPDYYKKRWVTFFHHLSRQAYKDADDVITLFERNSLLQKEIGAAEEKLSIVPNGIHFDRLSNIQKRDKTEVKLSIGAIVRVVPIKDIKTMINAAKILDDSKVPFELIIMGPLDEDKDYAEECQRMITQLEMEHCVVLAGKVNIMEYLPQFDVCLLTSISEGQPLAVLEGMAAGIPYIVSDVGSCSELIHGRDDDPYGPAGFVVPPVNPKQIAEYCEWIYHHPQEAIKLGKNGQKRAENYYQIHQFIEQYAELYEARGQQYGRYRI